MIDFLFGFSNRLPAGVFLGTLLVFGVACGDDDRAAGDGGSDLCQTSSDCSGGALCVEEVCVRVDAESIPVTLNINPPGFAENLVSQQIDGIEVRAGETLPNIALSAPVRFSGRALLDAADAELRLPVLDAEIRFVSNRGVAELRAQTTTTTSATNGSFEVLLPRGTYDVTIRPQSDQVPPARFINVPIRENGNRNFIVPSEEQARRLAGVLVRRDPVTGDRIPVAGARVFATSLDREYTSTTARTEEDGSFVVFAPFEARTYRLSVRRDPDTNVAVPNATFEQLPPLTEATRDRVFQFDLGAWHDPIQLNGRVTDDEGNPKASASVTARASIPGFEDRGGPRSPGAPEATGDVATSDAIPLETISFSANALSDDDGYFRMEIFPGTYSILGAGISRETAVSIERGIDFGPGGGAEHDVTLGLRELVEGFVARDASGAPLANAVVTFELREVDGERPESFSVASQLLGANATTDEEGRFELFANVGRHLVEIRPPETSPVSRFFFEREIESGSTTEEDFSFEMASSGTVTGRVFAPDGQALSGAAISLWTFIGERNRTLSSTVSASDGTFILRLPTSLNP